MLMFQNRQEMCKSPNFAHFQYPGFTVAGKDLDDGKDLLTL